MAEEEKAKLADKLIIANEEQVKLDKELFSASAEYVKSAAELVIANEQKAKRAAELVIANEEKSKRAAELVIANEEKGNRAAELVIANADKAKRAAELVIANADKAKRAAEFVIANIEKEHLADELIIADHKIIFQNEENLKLASELVIADVNRTKREAELVIANIEKTKLLAKLIITEAELSFHKEEKSKRAAKLVIADAEKAKRSAELVIANKELVFQKSEKSKREAELVIAKVLKAKRSAELVIANIEKTKRAAEFVVISKELMLSQEKERLIEELNAINEELRNEIEKRMQSEEALKESNEKYSEAFKSSPYSITITSLAEGRLIEVNDAFTTIFGFNREEAISNSTIRLDLWLNIEDRNSAISTLLDGRFISGKELLFKKKSGEIMIGLYSARLININKEPCIISSIDDITERKKMEFSLQESKITAERYLNIADELIMSLDVLGNITMMNDSGHRLLEYNKDELIGKNWFITCLPHDISTEVSGVFGKLMSGDSENLENLENLVLTKSGELKTIQFYNTILKDKDGAIKGIISSGRDITAHLKAEETLRNSFIFNETLLKTIPFGMDIVDETGTVLFQSENFKELFGEDAIGKKCWKIYRDDKKQCSACPLYNGIIPGETATYESHGVIGGRIFDISHTGMLYKGKKAMLEIFQDITERKAVEEELKSSKEKAEESDRLKSAFLSNMSHEIRTPMNGILGFAELLKEPTLTVEEQQDFIKTIGISGERMLSTINSIVDISKIEAGMVALDIKETNINDKLLFTHKFFKPEVESKGLKLLFNYSLPTNEAIIKTDNEKVYAILTNLVKNAIKFTHKGSIEFGYEKKGEYLEFYVKDTGLGIAENQKGLIFERFRQGSESHYRGFDGSGLGLSICKSYVEMLGGRIWAESEEGLGSTFYFTIPYIPVPEEIATVRDVVSDELKNARIKKLKILIVEDDEISYSLLTRIVQKISKEVLHAVNGAEAVQACQDNPDLDLILMDIRMPVMSGFEATQQIRLFNKDVIIIAQTAFGFSSDNEKALEAGCNDYIAKPIDKTILNELIKKHVIK